MIAEAGAGGGRPEVDDLLAFSFIVPAVHPSEVSHILRAALAQVQPLLSVELLPSSHGALLLRCASQAERDLLRSSSPFLLPGLTVYLQRPDEIAGSFESRSGWLTCMLLDTQSPNGLLRRSGPT
jgi:hypothetical protein